MTTTTPTLSSPGIGSGLDVNAIVDKLMAVERRPLDQLTTQETAMQSQISAYGTLKSALAALQGAVQALAKPAAFRSMTAAVGDSAVASATVADGATPGRYSLEVAQLAQSHKLVSTGFASVTDPVGSGTLTFTFGTFAAGAFTTNPNAGARTVTIPPGQDSLAGVRDAVNAANIGVTAAILDDGSANGQRLVFTATASGAANGIKLTVTDGDGADTDAAGLSQLAFDPAAPAGAGRNLTQTVAAQDALLTLDGIGIQSASNTVTGAIAGVSLTLARTNVGTPTSVSIAQSPGPAAAAVSAFVAAYNDAQGTIANLTRYDAANKKASILTGDGTVRLVQTQLRALIGGTIGSGTSGLSSLAQVGLTTATDGTLALDATKFNAALASNPRGVEQLFAATGSATDALVGYSGAGTKTVAGTYAVSVTQLATRGTLVGAGAAGLSISAGVNDVLAATIDGVAVNVTLAPGVYATAAALAAEVSAKINGALGQGSSGSAVTVTESGGTLTLMSKRYGSASSTAVSGTAAAALFGAAPVATSGIDVTGTIDGIAASGSGQSLTAPAGTPAEGLKISIAGGALGLRGSVTYAQGAGYGLDHILTGLLAAAGPVTARTDGLQSTIKDMDKRKDALTARLGIVQAAYLRQFNALDVQLSQMSALSTYLTQQLASLPKYSNGSLG